MTQIVNNFYFEKISATMSREFGSIKKGKEVEYDRILTPLEGNLLKINRKKGINNGRRAIEAIHICLLIINGYLKKIEYDLSNYMSSENEDYVKALLMTFDPFTNNEIFDFAKQKYDLDSTEDLKKYFTTPVKCLIRIEKSIELWTKEYGVAGYFDFIEEQFGFAMKNDGKMDYVVL